MADLGQTEGPEGPFGPCAAQVSDARVFIFYNKLWSTKEEQVLFHSLLPKYHDYGDKKSILNDNTMLMGREQHDEYIRPEMRLKCRKRCTIVEVLANQSGTKALDNLSVTICLSAIPDWQAMGLDAEAFFLKPYELFESLPRLGPYAFNIGTYVASTYEDLVMCFDSLKSRCKNKKYHLKLVPLGIGPTVRTRFNDYLGPLVVPAYLLALQYACNACIDASWVEALEFVDHTGGSLSPFVSPKNVRIISRTSRDAFDFTDCVGHPAIVAPCDAFCSIGSTVQSKNLLTTMANNSNLRSVVGPGPSAFIPWPLDKI